MRSRPVIVCRVCGGAHLAHVLSLGDVPPVNELVRPGAEAASEERFPLDVRRCSACGHVQLGLLLEPEDVFTEYAYFSGYADTIVAHGQALARRYREQRIVGADTLVAELASNDGAVLRAFKDHARIIGIDPARNVAQVANDRGITTLPAFFGRKLVPELVARVGRPGLVLARNVLAHVPDLADFVGGVADWIAPDGIFHVEVPYLIPMMENLAFDTIYHEHLSYFSVSVVADLLRRNGLELYDAEEIPLHGGSLMLRAAKPGKMAPSLGLRSLIERERAYGLDAAAVYQEFARRVAALRAELPRFLAGLRKDGARVAAYGASAKGVVLTNTCQLGPDLIDFIADRSPHKQGFLTPGMHIPIVPPERVASERPDYLVVLAWNFFDEIARQLAPYAAAGGRFVIPIPTPRVMPPTPAAVAGAGATGASP